MLILGESSCSFFTDVYSNNFQQHEIFTMDSQTTCLPLILHKIIYLHRQKLKINSSKAEFSYLHCISYRLLESLSKKSCGERTGTQLHDVTDCLDYAAKSRVLFSGFQHPLNHIWFHQTDQTVICAHFKTAHMFSLSTKQVIHKHKTYTQTSIPKDLIPPILPLL